MTQNYAEKKLTGVLSYIGFSMLIFLLIQKLLGYLLGLVPVSDETGIVSTILSYVQYVISIILPLIFIRHFVPGDSIKDDILKIPEKKTIVQAMGIMIGGTVLASVTTSLLISILGKKFGWNISAGEPLINGPATAIISFIGSVIAPAILEEIYFRGAVLNRLQPFGESYAAFFSALMFALCHSYAGQCLPAFVSGLILAHYTLKTGSLLTAVILHFSYNMLAFAAAVLRAIDEDTAGVLSALVFVCIGLVCLIASLRSMGKTAYAQQSDSHPGLSKKECFEAAVKALPFLLACIVLFGDTVVNLFK